MIVRFTGGPLAGLELPAPPDHWAGGWFRVGDGDWTLYRRVTDDGRGVVLAEAQEVTAPAR
ncbi:hypothetical protein [Streptomyces sp. NPDC057238]|uniref:hypothetical protein n=1 Tax=Streptomyces sp. NPDC057238 TaxID=3346060 RepID=UPI0036458FCB